MKKTSPPNGNSRSAGAGKSSAGNSWLGSLAIAIGLGALTAIGLSRCLDDEDAADAGADDQALLSRRVSQPDPSTMSEHKLITPEPDAETAPARPGQSAKPATADQTDDETPASISDAPAVDDPAPLDRRFPLHAVAYQFHTPLRAKPEAGASTLAYARRGATFRVGERLHTDGCKRGWHEVSPGGVFVCDGDGVQVADRPVSFSPAPPQARLDVTLPYRYAYVTRDDTPEYWRVPTAEEVREVEARLAAMPDQNAPVTEGENLDREGLREVLSRAAALSESPDGGTLPEPSPQAAPPTTAADPLAIVRLRMAKGYFVSVDAEVDEQGGRFVRTVRGRYVSADRLAPAAPSALSGVLLSEHVQLPLAFVIGQKVRLLEGPADGSKLREGSDARRYRHHPFLGDIDRGGRRYARIGETTFLPRRSVAVATLATPPAGIAEDERWIDVNLTEQTLVAYEGQRPVFATVVSTGREGFPTPTGTFRIYGKHVSVIMDDTKAGAESYSIEDVPWTMYFKDSFALHAAFWHDRFGRPRSHGCINLAPADARRLFLWAGPTLPGGVHGIAASRDNPGTRVVIHQ